MVPDILASTPACVKFSSLVTELAKEAPLDETPTAIILEGTDVVPDVPLLVMVNTVLLVLVVFWIEVVRGSVVILTMEADDVLRAPLANIIAVELSSIVIRDSGLAVVVWPKKKWRIKNSFN